MKKKKEAGTTSSRQIKGYEYSPLIEQWQYRGTKGECYL